MAEKKMTAAAQLPTRKTIRDLVVDTDTKARIENAAWMRRTSIAEVTREIVAQAVEGKFNDVPLPENLPKERARLGVIMTDDLWEQLGDAAWRERTTRVKLVQAGVSKALGDIPVNKEEVKL